MSLKILSEIDEEDKIFYHVNFQICTTFKVVKIVKIAEIVKILLEDVRSK